MATVVKFELDQGTTFERVLTFTDATDEAYILTNCTLRGQLREQFTDVSPAASFTFTTDALNGTSTLKLSDTVTAALQPITYYYDVELVTATGSVMRCFEGTIKVRPEVTK